MPVITISRQFGAGGSTIGHALADRFGAEYLDREIAMAVARRLGLPEGDVDDQDERAPGLLDRFGWILAAGHADAAAPYAESLVTAPPMDGDRLAALTQQIIREAAARGNAVIVGRGGCFVLRDRPGTLHVQLIASLEARIGFLRDRIEQAPADAQPDDASLRRLCQEIDQARGRYLHHLYGVDWRDSDHYALVIDTGKLGIHTATELIAAAAGGRLAH